MTTIIGLRADVEPKGIVIAADTQVTVTSEDGKKILGKQFDKKIRLGSFWAMADAGDSNRELNQFYANLKGQNRIPEKERHPVYAAVHKKRFMEINELNANLRRQDESMEDLPIFVLGVNYPSLGLWTVDEFGGFHAAIREREIYYVVAGSGGKRAAANIEEIIEDKIEKESFTIVEAIQTAVDALSGVERRDVQTSGIDLVVLTQKDILPYGKRIRDAIISAKQKEIDAIKSRYSMSQSPS